MLRASSSRGFHLLAHWSAAKYSMVTEALHTHHAPLKKECQLFNMKYPLKINTKLYNPAVKEFNINQSAFLEFL